ncbi:universal stress protein [Streptomyces triticiradicis]|uniref:Universal stress protein n=1 Tax=Streptomyces triticiradicis TaxID=2651189 RepID=A0A7J5DAL6_9ACTN|nr:universal stress protein [Streptomyces triticiradicis]KAB1985809.1 universal stress protein [Streptomyces triticiradicis]
MNAAVVRASGEPLAGEANGEADKAELPLVVGVDGSEPSLRAADWAADEAALRGVPLRVVYASLWERYEGTALAGEHKPFEEVRADDIVTVAARRVLKRHPDLEVSTEILAEEPEYALVRAGRDASALVLGTRGRSGFVEMLLGSVSLAVAAYADCPVIVLRGGHDNHVDDATARRVVVGVGETGKDSAAVRFAAEEARLRRAPLDAVRAWRCPAHESVDHPLLAGEPARLHEEQAVETLDEALKDAPAGVDVHRRTVEGPARHVLLGASQGAGLLVVGARRRPGRLGLQLGRVAHGVLHHAACPVAVVPEPA